MLFDLRGTFTKNSAHGGRWAHFQKLQQFQSFIGMVDTSEADYDTYHSVLQIYYRLVTFKNNQILESNDFNKAHRKIIGFE